MPSRASEIVAKSVRALTYCLPDRISLSDEVGEAICVRLIEGESLREICEDPDLPSQRTVYRWLAAERTFWQLYARAREAQMDRWAEEIVEIADDASNDYIERTGTDGEVERVLDPEAVQRSKLRIDTRKWVMSKLAAKRYGDKVAVDVTGSVEVSALSDAELEARTRARLVDLGVEVAGQLLLAKPGTAQAPLPVPSVEPEPVEVVDPGPGEPTPSSRSTHKKSTNDLLGLVV